MSAIQTLATAHWDLQDLSAAQRAQALAVVEDGGVLCLSDLPLPGLEELRWLLDPKWADPRHKNISYEPADRSLRGLLGDAAVHEAAQRLVGGFHASAMELVAALAPGYAAGMRGAAASLRLQQVEGRTTSWRKDDSRLHIDAFPSRPNRGERILRVFRNINPNAKPRVWRVGEPFADVAQRFRSRVPPYRRWQAAALHRLGVTKSLRSPYDHIMMHLHDLMKADLDYQRNCPQQTVPFAPGSTWVCFSDQTSHAVMSGQFMLEQTLHPAVAVMQAPAKAPISVLEALWQRPLA